MGAITPAASATATSGPSENKQSAILIVDIPLVNLGPDPFQPRKEFNESRIKELADSIEQHGLLQPLIVRPRQGPNSDGKYWIVGGERRFRAAQLLGMDRLPCRVLPYMNLTAAVTALVENVHREDLSDVDKAEGLRRIKGMTNKTWDEVAELVRLSPEYVRRLAGLVKLEDSVKTLVRLGKLSARTAIALKPLPPRQQVTMAERAVAEGLTAEQIREEVRRSANVGSTRTTSASNLSRPPAPLLRLPQNGEAVRQTAMESAARPAREGTVTHTLESFVEGLEGMSEWLDGHKWSPSSLSPAQQELVHRLYHAASQFQQRVAYIRHPLKEMTLVAGRADKNILPF